MSDTQQPTGRKTAGAFDVRSVIGFLLGVYGVILLLMGIFGDPETDKSGGVNSNLWAGLMLVVTSAVFLAWWKLRPLVVPPGEDQEGSQDPS